MDFFKLESLFTEAIKNSPFEGKVYLVGGACRDHLWGEQSWDWDLVVELKDGAENLSRYLSQKFSQSLTAPHPIGKGYPIWQLSVKENQDLFPEGFVLEIADSQSEMFPDPGSRDRVTRFGTLAEDCKRRDLTINMLYRNLSTMEWVDPSGYAYQDIVKEKLLRGYPGIDLNKIFSDDPLRILRLIRFSSYLGWGIETETVQAAQRQVPRLQILSFERIRDEWDKLFEKRSFHSALEMYREWNILNVLFPELLLMIGCEQDKKYHSEGDVWVHTLGVRRFCSNSRLQQLTGLLHDIGKPVTQSFVGDRIKFIDHEKRSVEIADKFLSKMKYGSELKTQVLNLIALHLRGGDAAKWSSLKPARKLLRDAGELIDELLMFIEADSSYSLRENGKPDLTHIPIIKARINEAKSVPLNVKPLVSGTELIDFYQRPAGPWIKEIQNSLREFEDDYVSEQGRSPTSEDIWSFVKTRYPKTI